MVRAHRAWCCAALLALAGCGFQLQGHNPLPAVVKSPYLEAPDAQSDFVASLRRQTRGVARPANPTSVSLCVNFA